MAYSSRSSDSSRNARPNRRERQRAAERRENRTSEREVVQSDELSSTSGARMISAENPYDPNKNPHASSAFPRVQADQPKERVTSSPSERPQRTRARREQDTRVAQSTGSIPQQSLQPSSSIPRQNAQPSYASGSTYPAGSTRVQAADRAQATSSIPRQTTEQSRANERDVRRDQQRPPMPSQTKHTRNNRTPNAEQPAKFVPYVGEKQPRAKRVLKSRALIVALVIVVAVGAFFGVNHLLFESPVQATVNGETMTLEGKDRTIEGLLEHQIVSVTPGNFVAVDNSVLREGDGAQFTATINDVQVDDPGARISEGDNVVITDGTDIMEEFTDSEPVVLPAGTTRVGEYGALHIFLPGEDGEQVTRTGNESGVSIQQVTKEAVDARLAYYNVQTNGEKVIALTFDDGPWDSQTDQILDILKEYNAKATFYTIGQQVSGHSAQIERMVDDGHEIATHTWDHAAGSGRGVSLNLMSETERQDEVNKGLEIIEDVSGKEASVYFRAPGGNFDETTAGILESYVQGEIGWNIDTEDWRQPGVDVIADRIMAVQPGGIVLMHDGGGDRSQTVEALRKALAYLSEQGYEFVTISELVERYPYEEQTTK